jgi:hypothetical protein
MDFSKLKRTSLHDRHSIVDMQEPAQPPASPSTFLDFWNTLPAFLKVNDLKALVAAIHHAKQNQKPVLFMMGAHPIKTGLSPWIIKAIENGFITGMAVNGACMVHDFELSYAGNTSEDVAEALVDGSFGMTQETGITINQWICDAAKANQGIGNYFGEQVLNSNFPYKHLSIFEAAQKHKVPITVHIALGTDVIHHHPEASGEAIGKTSMIDFHKCCETVSKIGDGGVVINAGSNVILPEVFLKALTVARNVTGKIHNFTTANFDMIQHYRPNQNVIQRPTIGGGKGYSFTGHHEIMLPLLFTALLETE